ncbi:IS110 family transposase [Dyadobacter luteus]|uniref:IS110 family transposase n=1 Tax=Dyadobacter luteus TaxID=2259619 RepID=A0A3D8Y666_9BACT|nr:IS110 family transposase [Dyadobacter luteus]REA58165.1 IS110 family transposase [Dyadobacter luteus]
MEKFLYFVGIDISKATLDFAVVIANKVLFHFHSSNDKDGIETFVKHLKAACPESNLHNSLYCMEHTGIYNNHLLNYLNSKKANVWVEHPVNIKESLGMIRGKNDKVDAKRIAFYAYKNRDEVRLWLPKREVIQKLDRLTATRNRLIKVRKILQSPLTDSQDFITKKDHDDARRACKKTMDSLKKDVQNIEKLIKEVIQSDIYLKELFEFIESVKGIGPTIAAEILISTNEFKDITDPKKFACHSGVVPFENQSGKYKGRSRTSNKANKQLKALLHNGAMSAIQHSPELREYYLRKTAEGKNQMLVINNVCNKLIHRVFACVREKRKYEDSFSLLVA